jgi:hypothetical protein
MNDVELAIALVRVIYPTPAVSGNGAAIAGTVPRKMLQDAKIAMEGNTCWINIAEWRRCLAQDALFSRPRGKRHSVIDRDIVWAVQIRQSESSAIFRT